MNTTSIIQTLLSTIVGGLIVIVTNWIIRQEERKKIAQDWYQQTYITTGTDPLIEYLLSLRLNALDKSRIGLPLLDKPNSIPTEALSKITVLLESPILIDIVMYSHACLTEGQTGKHFEKTEAAIADANENLRILRKYLLGATQTKVKSKHDEIDLSHLVPSLERSFEKLDAALREMIKA